MDERFPDRGYLVTHGSRCSHTDSHCIVFFSCLVNMKSPLMGQSVEIGFLDIFMEFGFAISANRIFQQLSLVLVLG